MSIGSQPDSFTFRAAELVRSIPKGKVATYGQIAGMAGNPRGARQVVRVLNTQKNLPWHRVLAAGGRITLPGPGGALQRKLLEVGDTSTERREERVADVSPACDSAPTAPPPSQSTDGRARRTRHNASPHPQQAGATLPADSASHESDAAAGRIEPPGV